ncbi:RdgB/HAM1 family non-canonical purine NTP pyrophosphatase [uncultured Roseivirga sp.]|uniref:RdgB/HAM1 family non-canonical purine NTP pyrophosphatase n=1 Tax=uncultured Roseivirga sp. TaxID=543088 RepID=UPI000D7B3D81|nr:RdgB/HAM1 family non-canonical purine NTP pyrophosphatase [uncultured Roseivirga sp.]PWL30178.1 MAG: non-canonical purine NTP pyrophosphatase, RdgB/HAM1 family [Roseivirga sp. XM-24bin3]
MKICFTTNNAHKLQEVKEILGDSIELLSLSDIGFEGDIPETHETLEENSLEKAQYIFQKYRIPVFSDDSGLEVVALNGKPGVHTAHYAGSRDAVANMSKVLSELEGQTNNREARFRAVITYIDLEGKEQQFEGIVDGQIAPEMSGTEGFGYDPIFIPKGYEKTFAELSSEVKNTISHRKRALEKLVQFLKSTT